MNEEKNGKNESSREKQQHERAYLNAGVEEEINRILRNRNIPSKIRNRIASSSFGMASLGTSFSREKSDEQS